MENPIAVLEEHARKQGLKLDEWISSIRKGMVGEGRFQKAPEIRKISKAKSREESLKCRQWILQKIPSEDSANV